MEIKPVLKTGSNSNCILNVTYKDIVEKLGFEPNVTHLDDTEKVKASWGFTVNEEYCGIWCYKFYGKVQNCDYWSFFGSREIAEKLFGKENIS
jgi:hypothetical protein